MSHETFESKHFPNCCRKLVHPIYLYYIYTHLFIVIKKLIIDIGNLNYMLPFWSSAVYAVKLIKYIYKYICIYIFYIIYNNCDDFMKMIDVYLNFENIH